jgi:protein gp37
MATGEYGLHARATAAHQDGDGFRAQTRADAGTGDKLMAFGTGIDYAHATFSPWIGCTKVSPGCANCYAEGVGKRMGVEWGPDKPRRFMPDKYWQAPLAWNRKAEKLGKRLRVFVSLCDVFELADVDIAFETSYQQTKARGRLWKLIAATPWLDWLIATKHPENMRKALPHGHVHMHPDGGLENLWLGVTCEDQQRADERIPLLQQVPAAVWWLSLEPQLELVVPDLDGIGWVVQGCESLGARVGRPFRMEWASDLTKRCEAAGVPMFLKQVPSSDGRLLKSAHLAVKGWPVQYPEPRP